LLKAMHRWDTGWRIPEEMVFLIFEEESRDNTLGLTKE
jgi:hypothetical protein